MNIFGIEVVVSEFAKEPAVPKFPYDRFVEYGPEDAWLVKYGIGEMYEKPIAYEVNIPDFITGRNKRTLYIHPVLFEQLATRKDLPLIRPLTSVLMNPF